MISMKPHSDPPKYKHHADDVADELCIMHLHARTILIIYSLCLRALLDVTLEMHSRAPVLTAVTCNKMLLHPLLILEEGGPITHHDSVRLPYVTLGQAAF